MCIRDSPSPTFFSSSFFLSFFLLLSFLSFFFRPCPLSFSDRAIALTSDPLFQGDVVLQTTDRPPHRNMTVCPHNVYGEEAGSRTGYPCLHFYGGTFSQRCFTSTETVRIIRDGEPRTATSTFTQPLSSEEHYIYRELAVDPFPPSQ